MSVESTAPEVGVTGQEGNPAGESDRSIPDHQSAPAGQSNSLGARERAAALVHATSLIIQSSAHGELSLNELKARLEPPIASGQFHLWHDNGLPFAFVSWAFLRPDIETRLLAGGRPLRPDEWSSGERLWIVDWVTSHEDSTAAFDLLVTPLFTDQKVRVIADRAGGELPSLADLVIRPQSSRTSAGRQKPAEVEGKAGAISIVENRRRNAGDVRVRQAQTEADIEAIDGMAVEYHEESRYRHHLFDRDKRRHAMRKRVAANPGQYVFFLAELKDRPVGMLIASVGPYAFYEGMAAQTLIFYVRPALLRSLIGGRIALKLLLAFRAWAMARKATALFVNGTNGVRMARADKFLRRLGFEQTGGNYELKLERFQ